MTHLPFIVASYALGVGVPVVLGLLAWQRLRQARRQLTLVDPRMAAP